MLAINLAIIFINFAEFRIKNKIIFINLAIIVINLAEFHIKNKKVGDKSRYYFYKSCYHR
jgi:hypothetical protein